MTAKAKKAVGLRLSEATIRELADLAKKYRVSQSNVVSVLVHCLHRYGEIKEERVSELFGVVERC